MYLVEGLGGDRVAVVTKTHPSMVDGHGGIDITQVLLDESPEPRRTVAALWMPEREPSALRLAADAVRGAVRRPAALADALRLSSRDARSTVTWLTGSVSGLATAATGALVGAARPSRRSPLRTTLGQHRRIAIERTKLADFRLVRERCGGTVNDVVLAVVTGAIRSWLLSRGETLAAATSVRALVPVGMNGDQSPGWTKASRVAGLLVDLPVGAADPLRRLAQIQYAMAAHSTAGIPVGADALVGLSGFAPPTLHSLGARAANGLTRRMYSVAVTNVPGPQQPLYAAGAQMIEMFPILPLNEGQALSIALTSYDGGVYFGVNADRDAVPDVAAVASWLGSALGDLLVVSTPADIEPGTRRRRARRAGRT
jgi:WS/DGAT/MGAT family acyltransferase